MQEIVNKVKQQDKLVTIDLEKFYPDENVVEFDIKNYLFKELILKEKEFRKALNDYDWSKLKNAWVAIHCSTDAIIAKWAYMLVASKAQPLAQEVFYGTPEEVREVLMIRKLKQLDWGQYENKFVLLKGCSTHPIPESIYLEATKHLLSVVKKLMYGEACSSVPVYNKPRK